MILIGARWDLLLGRNDECEVALDSKVDATNADAIIETFFDFEDGSFKELGVITAGFADLSAGVMALSIAANFLGTKCFLNDREGLFNVRGGISFDLLLLLNEDSVVEHELGRSDKDWRAGSNSRSRSMSSCSFSSRSLDVLIIKSSIDAQPLSSEYDELQEQSSLRSDVASRMRFSYSSRSKLI